VGNRSEILDDADIHPIDFAVLLSLTQKEQILSIWRKGGGSLMRCGIDTTIEYPGR
jgi:hypothetical protein